MSNPALPVREYTGMAGPERKRRKRNAQPAVIAPDPAPALASSTMAAPASEAGSDISGPVGKGRETLRMMLPPIEENGVWAFQRPPASDPAAFNFYRSARDSGKLDARHDITGLAALRLSGSEGPSSKAQIVSIFDRMGLSRLIVLDLRQEAHAIANGYAISLRGRRDWMNLGLDSKAVIKLEAASIAKLKTLPELVITSFPDMKAGIEPARTQRLIAPTVLSEVELMPDSGVDYERIAVADHLRPSRAAVDEFVDLVASMEEDTGLHVHCAGGRGRTTTFMIMYDMLHNADKVDAQSTIDRQAALGFDYAINRNAEKPYKHAFVDDRLAFLHEFHAYAKANRMGRPMLYSEWRMSDIEMTGTETDTHMT